MLFLPTFDNIIIIYFIKLDVYLEHLLDLSA